MHTPTSSSLVTKALVVGTVVVAFLLSTTTALAFSGAIFTTDAACAGTNVNQFPAKDAVYLDGGPQHPGSAGLPDGNYYAKVTVPNGDLLGYTTTASVVVSGGAFAVCYRLSDVLVKASDASQGYDDTTNGGGVYKVWVSATPDFASAKTDNFKVASVPGGGGNPAGNISGQKWNDLNADGVLDPGEPGLENWTINVLDDTSSVVASATTNAQGFYEISGLTPGTYQVCEVMQSTWYSSYPTMTDPNCHSAVVVSDAQTTLNVNFGNYQYATITVTKNVVAPDGTTDVADAHGFEVTVDGIAKPFAEGTDATYSVKPGTYGAVETADANYTEVSNDGPVTVTSGGTATIHIVNKQNLSHLVVIKHVITDNGGTAVAGDFTMNVTGVHASQTSFAGADTPGVDVTLWAGAYTADETAVFGYAKTLSADCSGTIGVGETKTCTITNDDIQPKLTVIKHIANPALTNKTAANFTMTVTGNSPSLTSFPGSETGTVVSINAGAYTANESATLGFIKTLTADCSGTIAVGQEKTCTITNTVPPQWCSPGFWKTAIEKNRTGVLSWLTGAGINWNTNKYSVIPGSLNPATLKKGTAATVSLAQVLGSPNTYGGPAFNSVADYFALKLGWTGTQATAVLYGEYCPLDANGVLRLF